MLSSNQNIEYSSTAVSHEASSYLQHWKNAEAVPWDWVSPVPVAPKNKGAPTRLATFQEKIPLNSFLSYYTVLSLLDARNEMVNFHPLRASRVLHLRRYDVRSAAQLQLGWGKQHFQLRSKGSAWPEDVGVHSRKQKLVDSLHSKYGARKRDNELKECAKRSCLAAADLHAKGYLWICAASVACPSRLP